jgi:hypothetical protein
MVRKTKIGLKMYFYLKDLSNIQTNDVQYYHDLCVMMLFKSNPQVFFYSNQFFSVDQRKQIVFVVSHFYSVFHLFRPAKFAYGSSILSSSQFFLMSQLPQKMKLASKVVKSDSKIIISLFDLNP